MELIKFCSPEHNYKKGAKLRLGSLKTYREIQDASRRDLGEGTGRFDIEIAGPVVISHQIYDLLFNARDEQLITAGYRAVHGPVFWEHKVGVGESDVEVQSSSVASWERVNCPVFSCSIRALVDPQSFPHCKDAWLLFGSSPDASARWITAVLNSCLQQRLIFPELNPGDLVGEKRFRFTCQHGPVKYGERNLVIHAGSIPTLDEARAYLQSRVFTKPRSFCGEQEYRFLFELKDPGGRTLDWPFKYLDFRKHEVGCALEFRYFDDDRTVLKMSSAGPGSTPRVFWSNGQGEIELPYRPITRRRFNG